MVNWFKLGKDTAQSDLFNDVAAHAADGVAFDPSDLAETAFEAAEESFPDQHPTTMQKRFYVKGFVEGWNLRQTINS